MILSVSLLAGTISSRLHWLTLILYDMKNVRRLIIAMGFIPCSLLKAQTVNWAQLPQRHILNIHMAADHALNYGLGYSYRLKTKRPVLLQADYSFPSGNDLTDDLKFRTGITVNWWKTGHFQFASGLRGIVRRYQSSYARLLNFGADLSATGGYYKKHWFLAGELGFDKAIVTHFKHSAAYKASFPGVKDGWYEPSTGGNIYYGIQGGWSFGNKDLYLKFGKLAQQDLRSAPMLPVYAELGFNLRLGRK